MSFVGGHVFESMAHRPVGIGSFLFGFAGVRTGLPGNERLVLAGGRLWIRHDFCGET